MAKATPTKGKASKGKTVKKKMPEKKSTPVKKTKVAAKVTLNKKSVAKKTESKKDVKTKTDSLTSSSKKKDIPVAKSMMNGQSHGKKGKKLPLPSPTPMKSSPTPASRVTRRASSSASTSPTRSSLGMKTITETDLSSATPANRLSTSPTSKMLQPSTETSTSSSPTTKPIVKKETKKKVQDKKVAAKKTKDDKSSKKSDPKSSKSDNKSLQKDKKGTKKVTSKKDSEPKETKSKAKPKVDPKKKKEEVKKKAKAKSPKKAESSDSEEDTEDDERPKRSPKGKKVVLQPVKPRLASLNAKAKVHMMYESEKVPEDAASPSDVKPSVTQTKSPTTKSTDKQESKGSLKKATPKKKVEVTSDDEVTSESEDDKKKRPKTSEKSRKNKKAKPKAKKKPKKKRTELDDLEIVDAPRSKRLASLNASAIMAASLKPPTPPPPKSMAVVKYDPQAAAEQLRMSSPRPSLIPPVIPEMMIPSPKDVQVIQRISSSSHVEIVPSPSSTQSRVVVSQNQSVEVVKQVSRKLPSSATSSASSTSVVDKDANKKSKSKSSKTSSSTPSTSSKSKTSTSGSSNHGHHKHHHHQQPTQQTSPRKTPLTDHHVATILEKDGPHVTKISSHTTHSYCFSVPSGDQMGQQIIGHHSAAAPPPPTLALPWTTGFSHSMPTHPALMALATPNYFQHQQFLPPRPMISFQPTLGSFVPVNPTTPFMVPTFHPVAAHQSSNSSSGTIGQPSVPSHFAHHQPSSSSTSSVPLAHQQQPLQAHFQSYPSFQFTQGPFHNQSIHLGHHQQNPYQSHHPFGNYSAASASGPSVSSSSATSAATANPPSVAGLTVFGPGYHSQEQLLLQHQAQLLQAQQAQIQQLQQQQQFIQQQQMAHHHQPSYAIVTAPAETVAASSPAVIHKPIALRSPSLSVTPTVPSASSSMPPPPPAHHAMASVETHVVVTTASSAPVAAPIPIHPHPAHQQQPTNILTGVNVSQSHVTPFSHVAPASGHQPQPPKKPSSKVHKSSTKHNHNQQPSIGGQPIQASSIRRKEKPSSSSSKTTQHVTQAPKQQPIQLTIRPSAPQQPPQRHQPPPIMVNVPSPKTPTVATVRPQITTTTLPTAAPTKRTASSANHKDAPQRKKPAATIDGPPQPKVTSVQPDVVRLMSTSGQSVTISSSPSIPPGKLPLPVLPLSPTKTVSPQTFCPPPPPPAPTIRVTTHIPVLSLPSASTTTLQAVRKSPPKKKFAHGWSWCGKGFTKNVLVNGEGGSLQPRTCYSSMKHVQGDVIRVGDSVLLRSGPRKTDAPFVAKITVLWEAPDGEMMMSLLWFYRPEHTEGGRNPRKQMPEEIFASKHRDVNPVATIDDKCFVLTFNEFCRFRKKSLMSKMKIRNSLSDRIVPPSREVYPRLRRLPSINSSPDMIFCCRKVYDFRLKRVMKNPN